MPVRHLTKPPTPQPPPVMVGTVVTPDTPQPPNNYIAAAALVTTDVAELRKLRDHAIQHGYSPEGQTVKAIDTRLAKGAKGAKGASPTPKKVAKKSRGAKR